MSAPCMHVFFLLLLGSLAIFRFGFPRPRFARSNDSVSSRSCIFHNHSDSCFAWRTVDWNAKTVQINNWNCFPGGKSFALTCPFLIRVMASDGPWRHQNGCFQMTGNVHLIDDLDVHASLILHKCYIHILVHITHTDIFTILIKIRIKSRLRISAKKEMGMYMEAGRPIILSQATFNWAK